MNLSGNALGIRTGPVIETDTPGERVRTSDDIGLAGVSTARPPAAVLGLSARSRVGRAGSVDGRVPVWDIEPVEFFQPLLDFVRA